MANPTNTKIDFGGVLLALEFDTSEVVTWDGDIAAGTIMGRLSATGKLVVFVKGGTAGAEIPVGVLTYDAPNHSGSSDESLRVLRSGLVRFDKLIIAADGNASNVDYAVLDQLLHFGVKVDIVKQNSTLDNGVS